MGYGRLVIDILIVMLYREMTAVEQITFQLLPPLLAGVAIFCRSSVCLSDFRLGISVFMTIQ